MAGGEFQQNPESLKQDLWGAASDGLYVDGAPNPYDQKYINRQAWAGALADISKMFMGAAPTGQGVNAALAARNQRENYNATMARQKERVSENAWQRDYMNRKLVGDYQNGIGESIGSPQKLKNGNIGILTRDPGAPNGYRVVDTGTPFSDDTSKMVNGILYMPNALTGKYEAAISPEKLGEDGATIKTAETLAVDFTKHQEEFYGAEPRFITSIQAMQSKYDRMAENVALAKELLSNYTTKYGASLKNLPGTESRTLNNILATLKANVFVDELTDMRNNSPTGGAVGNVSDAEGERMSSLRDVLDQYETADVLSRNLDNVLKASSEAIDRSKYAYKLDKRRYGSKVDGDPFAKKDSGGKPDLIYDPKTGEFK